VAENNRIILVKLTHIDEAVLKALKDRLESTFHRSVEIRSRIGSLEYAYVPPRRQYDSPEILVRLRRTKRDPGDKVLGVVDVDLFSPGFEFIYGEAEVATGVGTLSLFRLRPENSRNGNEILLERAVKEAIHELGHLFGLRHCRNRRCVMRFCPEISGVDEKMAAFCSKCSVKLDAARTVKIPEKVTADQPRSRG
jgi:archaemetzincin